MIVECITEAEANRAFKAWGANCGPGAIAAITGMSLDSVRPNMGDFESKKYTSPTMMWAVLERIGRPWQRIGKQWPRFGLVRIQWEGPWTEPNVPIRARYRFTHWIASWKSESRGHGVFDINCCGNGTGWTSRSQWEEIVAPYIIQHIPRAYPSWHITHGVEVEPKKLTV